MNTNKCHTEGNQQSGSSFVTADIYVYARKRPQLACEAQFNDAVHVEQIEHLNDQNRHLFSSSNICINEVKTAVDGTPILRKVTTNNCLME